MCPKFLAVPNGSPDCEPNLVPSHRSFWNRYPISFRRILDGPLKRPAVSSCHLLKNAINNELCYTFTTCLKQGFSRLISNPGKLHLAPAPQSSSHTGWQNLAGCQVISVLEPQQQTSSVSLSATSYDGVLRSLSLYTDWIDLCVW